jgi:flagellar hook-associated protein 2
MAGISSLGIGSGVLTADVIEQLREADEATQITPIEDKISLNNQKQEAYTLLSSLMTTLKSSASALSYDTVFDNKNVDVSGNAEVDVTSGATVESFTLETVTLAKKDINQFGSLASKAASVAAVDGTLEINIGADPVGNPDDTININYTAGMTLSELAQEITDQAQGKVEASILQVGDGEYSLVLSSANTGEDQQLSFNDVDGNLDAALLAGLTEIQAASDSEFKYNGITATRSTNEISDLILGVDITLKQEGDFSNVEVEQDTISITDEMQLFVDSYNALIQNISDMTLADEETGAEGVFANESFVKGIKRDITNVITGMFNGDSLVSYGLDLDRSGMMSFDKSAMETKLAEDPDGVKLFFTGGTDANGNDKTGIFEMIDDKIKSYTGYGQMLSNFETSLKTEGTSLSESYSRAMELLNTRYEIMERRFSAYDSMISKLNSQFSSLQMMISAEVNSDN